MSLPVLKSFGRRRSSDAMSKEVKHLEDVDESPEDFEALHVYYTKYPNRWSRVR